MPLTPTSFSEYICSTLGVSLVQVMLPLGSRHREAKYWGPHKCEFGKDAGRMSHVCATKTSTPLRAQGVVLAVPFVFSLPVFAHNIAGSVRGTAQDPQGNVTYQDLAACRRQVGAQDQNLRVREARALDPSSRWFSDMELQSWVYNRPI